jgi:adenylate cyclase
MEMQTTRTQSAGGRGSQSHADPRGLSMPRAIDWLYAKAGPHYFETLLALWSGAVLLFVVPGYTAILLPYFHATSGQYLRFLGDFEIALTVGVVGMFVIAVHRHAPLIDWLRGRRSSDAAPVAWESAVAVVPRTTAIFVPWFALCCAPAAIYVGSVEHLSLLGLVLYILVLVLLILGAIVFGYLLFEQALRPVVREIAAQLPPQFASRRRTPSLGDKLLALLPAIIVFTGILVAAVSTNSLGLEGRLAVTVGVTLLVSMTLGLALTLMFRQSLRLRLIDLQEAIARVDGGDYGARMLHLAGDELDDVGDSFNAMVAGLREREVLQGALGSYVDASIATRVLSEGEVLRGRELEVTVLFLDIRGFTSLADRSAAADVVQYLGEFFELVIPIIGKHHGHTNQLLGDGLLAVFGAPLPLDGHADHAVEAAREILDTVWRRYEGELRIGVGLNSGDVVAGTIGGGGKLHYGLIGDTVNVAARVEALTKDTGDPLLITESTQRLLTARLHAIEPRGAHRLRGKARETLIYAVYVPLPLESRRPASSTSASVRDTA